MYLIIHLTKDKLKPRILIKVTKIKTPREKILISKNLQ